VVEPFETYIFSSRDHHPNIPVEWIKSEWNHQPIEPFRKIILYIVTDWLVVMKRCTTWLLRIMIAHMRETYQPVFHEIGQRHFEWFNYWWCIHTQYFPVRRLENPSVKTAPPLTPFTWRVDLWPRRRLTKHGACTCSLWVYFEGIVIRTIQNSYLYNVHTYIHTRIHPYIHTYMHICLYHIRIIYIYIYHTCIYI
jgi:hypothetical protein